MAESTIPEGVSYPEYTGIPYTYWTGLLADPEGTGGYGIIVERRNPEYKEEPSLAYTTWDSIKSLVQAVTPTELVKDIINYNDTNTAKNPADYTWGLVKDLWLRNLGRVSKGLKVANWWSPSMHIGATRDAMQNGFSFRRYGNNVINGNPGLFNEEGFWPAVGNALFDLAITSPRAVASLADNGVTYLSGLGRNMPPPAGAVSVVDNGVIPLVAETTPRFSFPTEGWNGVSTLPAVNEAGDQFMAFGETRRNPHFDPYSHPTPEQFEFYPLSLELTLEELLFIKDWAEKNGIDLSNVNIREFYKSIRKGKKPEGKYIETPIGTTVGYIGPRDPLFNDITYRIGRILEKLAPLDPDSPAGLAFLKLGVKGAIDEGPTIGTGRALAADIRAQLWNDGYLTAEHLANPETFEFTSGDLLDYLLTAHGGQYTRNPSLNIEGLTKTPDGSLDWIDPDLAENIARAWKDAIFYFKLGNKLVPKQHSI